LTRLFEDIKGRLTNIPIFITQHMPPTFTALLAKQLGVAGGRECYEAANDMVVKPGAAYIAAGDFHMLPERNSTGVVLRITQDAPENYCRPAADPMFRALSVIYGSHLLSAVLTGIGQDGMQGCKAVVAAGGSVIAQNEESCVVYGMPRAVVDANLCRAVLPISEMGSYVIKQIEGW